MNDQLPAPLYSLDLTLKEIEELTDLLENCIPEEEAARTTPFLDQLYDLISLATAPPTRPV
ncbi:hypothetical protein NC974_01260 [Leptolyngbya sp. SLC-A1]|uniref:hypothetical protein n=1 Tax=Leptolyngbya sp. GB2-A1 TaxID=2933914 RepID=UPI00168708D6